MLLNIKTLNGKKQIQTERERDKYRRNKPDELLENLRDLRIYKYCLCFKGIQKKKKQEYNTIESNNYSLLWVWFLLLGQLCFFFFFWD